MNKNLIEINKEITKSIGEYLEDYYRKDIITPYLNAFVLEFIKNCRYRNDDVRPILTKLGYEIAGGEEDIHFILPAMAAIHLLLLSFIPIDDVIDGLERQKNYSYHDLSATISQSYSISTKLREDSRIIFQKKYGKLSSCQEIEKIVSECLERLNGSHFLEVVVHGKKPISKYSITDYINLVDEATSIFIAESFTIGGLIAGIDKKTEKDMRSFGMDVGRLCQIRDDFLDYIDCKVTGKFSFADLYSRRKRFPIIVAYWFGSKDQKNKIKEILKKDCISDIDIQDVLEMILNNKIREKTQKIIKKIRNEAIKKLKSLPQRQPSFNTLEDLVSLFSLEQ